MDIKLRLMRCGYDIGNTTTISNGDRAVSATNGSLTVTVWEHNKKTAFSIFVSNVVDGNYDDIVASSGNGRFTYMDIPLDTIVGFLEKSGRNAGLLKIFCENFVTKMAIDTL